MGEFLKFCRAGILFPFRWHPETFTFLSGWVNKFLTPLFLTRSAGWVESRSYPSRLEVLVSSVGSRLLLVHFASPTSAYLLEERVELQLRLHVGLAGQSIQQLRCLLEGLLDRWWSG